MVRPNSPDICQGSSKCTSNFLEVLSTIWQQQESERLNKLSKPSQRKKNELLLSFLSFSVEAHVLRVKLLTDLPVTDMWPLEEAIGHGGTRVVSFFSFNGHIYKFTVHSLQFANDYFIQLSPSLRFLWCGASPASRPIMIAHISAKPFLNCPQGWQGNINIHTNSNFTKKSFTCWHLSLPVLGQFLTVYFLELNPVLS